MTDVITNLTGLTELEAVNSMLAAIGEAPVSTLTGATQADVQMAINILRDVTREVQSWGWRFNTEFGMEILPGGTYDYTDSTGKVTTLKVFLPPAHLVAFRVSDGPTQQGNNKPDTALRPPRIYGVA